MGFKKEIIFLATYLYFIWATLSYRCQLREEKRKQKELEMGIQMEETMAAKYQHPN